MRDINYRIQISINYTLLIMMFVYKHCRWPTASYPSQFVDQVLTSADPEEKKKKLNAEPRPGNPCGNLGFLWPSYGHLVGMIWDNYFGYYGIIWDNDG